MVINIDKFFDSFNEKSFLEQLEQVFEVDDCIDQLAEQLNYPFNVILSREEYYLFKKTNIYIFLYGTGEILLANRLDNSICVLIRNPGDYQDIYQWKQGLEVVVL